MKRMVFPALFVAAALAIGCSRPAASFEIPAGTEVSVEKRDGVTVSGKLVEVQPQEVVLERPGGERTRVQRSEIARLQAIAPKAPKAPPAPSAPALSEAQGGDAKPPVDRPTVDKPTLPAPDSAAASAPVPRFREVTIPAGTVLPVELRTAVGSATSKVEDPVRGTVRRAVAIGGVEAIPAGSVVAGTVTEAERSARVKGRARIGLRFSSLDTPGDAERLRIRTATYVREAEGTKKKDAATIGGGAAAGAVIGGIVGGGDGAAKGAAIGGGAGTGVVLSTRGKEVSLPAGTAINVKLTEPVTMRVRVK
jgi:hypothetical protein